MIESLPFSIKRIRQKLLSGEFSCVELAQELTASRAATPHGVPVTSSDPSAVNLPVSSSLGAFHQFNEQLLLSSAAASDLKLRSGSGSALCGIPMTVKSVFGVDGFACYAGCSRQLPAKWARQGSVVSGLRSAGAFVTGITHAAELSVGGLGVNEHYPTPRNPWDMDEHRIPGGSSSGAGGSLWERAGLFALGTDTGGSVRVPASAAGLVGLKTSNGRWPLDGVVPLASRFDTIGALTHSVEDMREVCVAIDLLSNVDSSNQFAEADSLRLEDFKFMRASGLCWQDLDPGIENAIEQVLEILGSAGLRLHDSDSELFARAADLRDKGPNTAAFECRQLMLAEFPYMEDHLSLHVREFLASAIEVDKAIVEERVARVLLWRESANAEMGRTDIIIAPTLKLTPPTVTCVQDREQFIYYSDELLHNTVLASMNGFCALTLPVGLDDCQMPVGLQLAARMGGEAELLRAASLIEQTIGTAIARFGLPPALIQSKQL